MRARISNVYDSLNEKELLLQVASGDEEAYRFIYEKYAPGMFNNALRFTKSPEMAEDITQDIFLKIWVNRSKLTEVRQFDSYLYVVARNIILNELKKQLPVDKKNEYVETFLLCDPDTVQDIAESRELDTCLKEAINKLPPQMQAIFRLSRFEGLTHDQIARKMNISPITSKSYIVRALMAIRRSLAEKGMSFLVFIPFRLLF